MRAVIQRVKQSQVTVNKEVVGKIGPGLLVLLAVAKEDQIHDIEWTVRKITELRIFEDQDGKMNLSVLDINAEISVVSQFTLLGDCRKGRRPSFDEAADPKKGEEFYLKCVELLQKLPIRIATGQFRAMMEVELINDGPVTMILDSRIWRLSEDDQKIIFHTHLFYSVPFVGLGE